MGSSALLSSAASAVVSAALSSSVVSFALPEQAVIDNAVMAAIANAMILFVFFMKLFFSLLLFKNTLKNISSERDSGRGCAAFYQLPFFLISSRSYFSFQCISFQMREASEFPLIPIGCKP